MSFNSISKCSVLTLFFAGMFASTSFVRADTRSEVSDAYVQAYGAYGSSIKVANVLSQIYNNYDLSGDGLSSVAIDQRERLALAGLRSSNAQKILVYDIDGDLRVGRSEVEEAVKLDSMRYAKLAILSEIQKKQVLEKFALDVERVMKADRNNDNLIIGQELYAPLNEDHFIALKKGTGSDFARALLKADPNQDGLLTKDEASLLFEQNLEGIDAEIHK